MCSIASWSTSVSPDQFTQLKHSNACFRVHSVVMAEQGRSGEHAHAHSSHVSAPEENTHLASQAAAMYRTSGTVHVHHNAVSSDALSQQLTALEASLHRMLHASGDTAAGAPSFRVLYKTLRMSPSKYRIMLSAAC
jgi:hypothetical protein